MPELHRTTLVGTLIVGLTILGCSGKSAPPSAPAAPSAGSSTSTPDAGESRDGTLSRAREELERGKELAAEGLWSEARLRLDEAVDLLLELPGGVVAGEAKLLYDEVLATVHEMERSYLAEQRDERASEQAERAAVDELTSAASEELSEERPDASESAVDIEETKYDLPVETNGQVLSLIRMYKEEKREWFQEALDRSAHFMPMFREVFEEEGLPLDLVYLSMVESAFKTRAVSRAGARGLWQFIRGTGRRYGLGQDFWVDERFDPEKATRAAARHLKDLYEEFGDWYLVMAAYNSGARRVERAIRRTGSRDFWTLARARRLPRETRSYVPLILAAIVIAKDPEAHGFRPPADESREYDVVVLEHPVDLATAAESAGSDLDEMKLLNPQLRRWVTPLDRDDFELRVPKGRGEHFRERIAAIPASERVRFGTHVVRRGDSLSRIASRYGTTVNALVAANRIRRSSLIHPGQVLTVPVPPGTSARAFETALRESVPDGDRDVYVVRRGDTLGAIARSFGVSLAALRSLNDMDRRASRIYPGQRLVVVGGGSPPPARSARAPVLASNGDVYVVKPGDTLGGIAEAHGLGLSVLRRLNGFSRRQSRIYPGQSLVVRERSASAAPPSAESFPSPAASASTADQGSAVRYVIRRGDTLIHIARRFGVSVEEIRRWNEIHSDRIVAGDSIQVYLP